MNQPLLPPAVDGRIHEDAFRDLVREVCRDGKISPDELQMMRDLGRLLHLPGERANALVNHAIGEYRAGTRFDSTEGGRQSLVGRLRAALESDGKVDAHTEDVLSRLQGLLGLPLGQEEKTPAGDNACQPSLVAAPQIETVVNNSPHPPAEALPATSLSNRPSGDAPAPLPVGSASWMEQGFAVPADRLEPLLCNNCQGMVPLIKAKKTVCPYCSHPVDIPAKYQEAITSRRVLGHRQQKMEELFRTLGQRPGRFMGMLAEVPEILAAFLITVLIILTNFPKALYSLIMTPLVVGTRYFWNENLLDLLTVEMDMFFTIFPYFLAYFIPLLLLHRFRRRVLTLGQFRFSLAAGNPKIPGGPETCRQCGAPLHVPENAVGVTCPYCATDNLVGIPPEIMAINRAQTRLVGSDLERALAAHAETSRLGMQTATTMIVALLAFTLLGAYMKRELSENLHWPPVYRQAVNSRTGLIQNRAVQPVVKFDEWQEIVASPGALLQFYVALKADETLEVAWKPAPGKPWKTLPDVEADRKARRLAVSQHLHRSFRQRGESELLHTTTPPIDNPTRFQIGQGGWYRIDLELPEAGPILLRPSVSKGNR